MELTIFIFLTIMGVIFTIFGFRSLGYAALGGILLILTGLVSLQGVTITHVQAVYNNTSQSFEWLTYEENVLTPPLDTITSLSLIFGGLVGLLFAGGGSGDKSGYKLG